MIFYTTYYIYRYNIIHLLIRYPIIIIFLILYDHQMTDCGSMKINDLWCTGEEGQ